MWGAVRVKVFLQKCHCHCSAYLQCQRSSSKRQQILHAEGGNSNSEAKQQGRESMERQDHCSMNISSGAKAGLLEIRYLKEVLGKYNVGLLYRKACIKSLRKQVIII